MNTNKESSALQWLQTIQTALTTAGENVGTLVDKINEYMSSETEDAQTKTIMTSIEQIGEAVSSLTSSDTTKIVKGVLDVMSAVTPLIQQAGEIMKTVFSLVSTVISATGGSSQDIGGIVEREIENALQKFDDSNLRAEAHGTARMYSNSLAYLSAKEEEYQIQEYEIASMSSHVPIYQGVKFLGILTSKIKDNTVSQDLDQVKRAMEYTKLYVILAVLRSAVLWKMYSVVRAASHSDWTAAAIKRVAEAEEDTDKRFIQYLVKPDYSQAVFFASFSISEWPEVSKFLEKKGLEFQNLNYLTTGMNILRPQEWKNWNMMMCGNTGYIGGYPCRNGLHCFIFNAISAVDNVFYIRPYKWPSWYIYMVYDMSGNCYCSSWKPGPQGEWKVVRFSDGKYMLSPVQWPNYFIYMRNNPNADVRGWVGDPGVQGHWIIDKIVLDDE